MRGDAVPLFLSHLRVHLTHNAPPLKIWVTTDDAISSHKGAISGYPVVLLLRLLIGMATGIDAGMVTTEVGIKATQPFDDKTAFVYVTPANVKVNPAGATSVSHSSATETARGGATRMLFTAPAGKVTGAAVETEKRCGIPL
jgi:hypothetical protein